MKQPTRVEAWIQQTNEQKGYGQLPAQPRHVASPNTISRTSAGGLSLKTPPSYDSVRQLDRPRYTCFNSFRSFDAKHKLPIFVIDAFR